MKVSYYTLPAKGQAPLAVLATQPSRRVEVQEDGAAAAQGIVLFRPPFPTGNNGQALTYLPGFEPVVLGEKNLNNRGGWLGLPAQTVQAENPVGSGNVVATTLQPATTLFKGTSASNTPTNIIVTEFD